MNLEFTATITAEDYLSFRDAVGWMPLPVQQAQEGLDHSYVYCLRRDGMPVALGRVVWDHGYVVYITDIIVLPEYRGNGYGRMIMDKIMNEIRSWLKPGYKVMISLLSAHGKEEFYERFGFKKRPYDRFGCGMSQWISSDISESEV